MISYAPLWETMKKRGVTTYALRNKHNIGGGTIQRLRKNLSVSTNTLDDLCIILHCTLPDIAKFVDACCEEEQA